MEEVDSIILHFLRQLNINFDDDVKNVCDIPVTTIIEAASTCLNTINPNLNVPRTLPSNISHRIEVAAQIATFCKDLGYKNDVGYQTFLYSNEAELRQVFMFLIERLPNEGKHETGVNTITVNRKSLLLRDIGNKIGDEMKSIWIPPCCKPVTNKIGDFCDQDQSSLTNSIPYTDEEIVQKLLRIKDWKGQRLGRSEVSIQDTTKESKEINTESVKINNELNKNLKELKEMAIVLRQKLDTLESDRNVMEVEYSQAQRACDRVNADLKNVENILRGIGISEDDPKGESLLDKVQKNINMLHKKSEDLTSRNLSLKVEIDKSNTINSESERMKYKKILSDLKDTAKNMKDECDKKEVFRNRLKVNYEKLRGGNKRSIYTKRIMEIINNVDKQNMEIKKILDDTRQLQKEINSLEGQLDRCFSIADETLFKVKMSKQWGQKAEELEISNKVAGLGLNKPPLDQSNDSDDTADKANPADTSLLMKIIRQGLVESKLDIEIQRKDPNSPLYSVKTFEALHLKPNLLKGVYAMGFNAPSKIQETALPTLLADPPQNMIAQSQSGTGKTAAFVLAMLSRVDHTKNYPQVLCLSPTYELAIQTGEVAAKMAKFCPEIKLKYAVRGEELPKGTKITDHILIGTPGKMMDWGVKFGMFDLNKIKVFVLDEADVMIDRQGHQDQCIRIHKCLPSTCQMMFFSATYDTAVMEFAEIIVPNPIIIRLLREEESLDNIKQYYVKCKNPEEKYKAICNIYGVITIGQAIIFCHTRKTASWLSEKMSKDGHSVAVLSGELTVEQRIAVLDRFRAGLEKVLITTNVLSRGIDVEQVTLVVNFDMPMDMNRKADCETYLHRIGRTGRFGKAGIAINLIDSPQTMEICNEIEAHFGKKIHLLDIEDAEEIEKIGA